MSSLNQDHLDILRAGPTVWNRWREAHPEVEPRLEGADLRRANLEKANLRHADLRRAQLLEANLVDTDFEHARLDGADLSLCLAIKAGFVDSCLDGAILRGGAFPGARFRKASLREADLQAAQLTEADLSGADLVGAKVFGVSAWKVTLESKTSSGPLVARQKDLLITREKDGNEVRVDDLRIAQLIYLIQDNARIGDVIHGMSNKTVLVLGRFTPERRMAVLDTLRDSLRAHPASYLPVIFTFRRPEDRDWAETVRILAGLARFVIVDLTSPKSVPLELEAVVPSYQIPFVPIIERGEEPFSMFTTLYNQFAWVLEPFEYRSVEDLERHFDAAIVARANEERERLKRRKARTMKLLGAADFAADHGPV